MMTLGENQVILEGHILKRFVVVLFLLATILELSSCSSQTISSSNSLPSNCTNSFSLGYAQVPFRGNSPSNALRKFLTDGTGNSSEVPSDSLAYPYSKLNWSESSKSNSKVVFAAKNATLIADLVEPGSWAIMSGSKC